MITATFNLNWPTQVNYIFELSSPLSEASTALVSFDCWMDTRNATSINRYDF